MKPKMKISCFDLLISSKYCQINFYKRIFKLLWTKKKNKSYLHFNTQSVRQSETQNLKVECLCLPAKMLEQYLTRIFLYLYLNLFFLFVCVCEVLMLISPFARTSKRASEQQNLMHKVIPQIKATPSHPPLLP